MVFAVANFEAGKTCRIQKAILQTMDRCVGRSLSVYAEYEFIQRRLRAVCFDDDPFRRIRNPAVETQPLGQAKYKGPKPDPLDRTADNDSNACQRRHNTSMELIQDAMPVPVFEDSSKTRMPGRTVWI